MNLKNLALGYVKTAPSPATTGTSLTLETGEGARFPETTTESFYVTLAPADANAHSENSEVVEVTDRTGDVLTIVRGRRGTTAQSVAVGWIVLNSVYKEDLDGLSSNSLCRQAIINGNFDVWQRGTSFTNPTTNDFVIDRFFLINIVDGGTDPTLIYSRQAITPGELDGSKYFLRINPNGAGQVMVIAHSMLFNTK